MDARILSITNAKGGCGKTTLSMMLAAALTRRDGRVLVVDGDPAGAASEWAASADDDRPFPAPVVGLAGAGSKIHREVRRFVDQYDFIILDCPPAADSPIPRSALLVSDLALIPIIPSPLDLRASKDIRQLVRDIQVVNETLEARLVVNQITPNSILGRETIEVLPEFGIPVFDTHIAQRAIYRQSAVFGQTVYDFAPRAAAAIQEIESLTDEVLAALGADRGAAREAGGES
jgi:chromosome partitioning protein